MRTVVLLNARKEQITNSAPGPANHYTELLAAFPQDTNKPMPAAINWNGRSFLFFDHPKHDTDEPNSELYRYIESGKVNGIPEVNNG